MRVLELFSGTHSVGRVYKEKGYEVVSLDLCKADINIDIMQWDYKTYDKDSFDIIWASPPCVYFSVLRLCCVGRKLKAYDNKVATREMIDKDMIEKGLPILRKTQEIINYFNCKYWFIENPQTARTKNFMEGIPYYDVDYCKYSSEDDVFDYRKRTRIWTNLQNFTPKICKKDCKHIVKTEKRTFHKNNCGRTFYLKHSKDVSKDYGGGTNRDMRYRIPKKLTKELIKCMED